MAKRKKKTSDHLEKIKMEIAMEIGLLDKINAVGWGGLSAKESGRIGGILTHRLKEQSTESACMY